MINDNYTVEVVKIINMITKQIRKQHKDGLKFQKLDLYTMKIVVYSDGYFSTNNDGSSQVAYKIFLADKNNDDDIVDCTSVQSRRVVILALGSERFRLADACDHAIIMQHEVKHIFRQALKCFVPTNSETLCNVVISNGHTTE